MSSRRLLSSLILLAAPAVASAQFVNPGFETPVLANGSYSVFSGGQSLGGWDVVGTQVLLLQTNYVEPGNGIAGATQTFNAHSGLNSLDLTGAGNNGLTAGVQQFVSTAVGQLYSVSFWVGKATGGGFYATPSTVDLSIDGGSRVSFTNSGSNPNAIDWQQFSYNFTASSASTLVTFYNGTPDNSMVGLDDVSITRAVSAVPEPATVALMLGGLPVLGLVARRRRRTA